MSPENDNQNMPEEKGYAEILEKINIIEQNIKGIPAEEIPTIKSVVEEIKAMIEEKEVKKDGDKKYGY